MKSLVHGGHDLAPPGFYSSGRTGLIYIGPPKLHQLVDDEE